MAGERVLEYRARDDDAWYSVHVAVKGDTLTIQFQGLQETDKFVASNFESEEDIDGVVQRFREVSPQLQDNECGRVTEGSLVCAACHDSYRDDMRYYDALVEAVHRKKHSLVNGQEECLCEFVLSWTHGPKEGLFTIAGVASICTIKDDCQVDQQIASFSKLAKDKLQVSSRKSTAIPRNKVSALKGSVLAKGGSHLSIDQKATSSQDIQNGWKLDDGKGETKRTMSNHDANQDQDKDLGGETLNSHFILIGNLERTLSPSSIREFIYRHTFISPQAYILLSSSTPFARAVIVLDCKKQHEKVYRFLDNPDHFVVSMRGRPWVVIESVSKHGMHRTSLGSVVRKIQEKHDDIYLDNELMVVRSGTEAYKCAQQLRDLFMELHNHEKQLYRRFVEEEMRILQPLLSNEVST
ncbi:PREDICTED: uncharacterized protein LOC109188036 isoform X2 [Ipomoea nil]|uniref:uncharacterized protein LOC109188036 isoform X2 n=1 Tax=Ipomoea nil TaxID=35883 RepID=UPI000901972C|nr:PREDICTED: uncharacterized protein LOC109188036 isoform X2 [Ipomoea nil]